MKLFIGLVAIFISNSSHACMSAYVRFKNPTSHLCLGVDSKSVGTAVKPVSCSASNGQTFLALVHADGSHVFKNRTSGLCLGIRGALSVQKTVIEQQVCDQSSKQSFTPSFVRTGEYNLISQLDGSCITAFNSTASSAYRYNCRNASSQSFDVQIVSGELPLNRLIGTEVNLVPTIGPSLPAIQQGVHLGGGESGDLESKNIFGQNYLYPPPSALDYFKSKGLTTIRLSFKLSRLQPTRGGPLDQLELSRLNKTVQAARARGMWVILDPHDYGFMANETNESKLIGTNEMPSVLFADFWAHMAQAFKYQPNIVFGLMNEPHGQSAEAWQPAAILAYSAIRQQGARQLVLIPGTAYTSGFKWLSSGNGKVWQGFRGVNYAFEIHQYVDTWSSGTLQTCPSGNGGKRLIDFTNWARANHHRAFVGEIGFANNSPCMNEGKAMLTHIRENSDVFLGFTYFGAGWYNGFMTINPLDFGKPTQTDQPQLKLIGEVF